MKYSSSSKLCVLVLRLCFRRKISDHFLNFSGAPPHRPPLLLGEKPFCYVRKTFTLGLSKLTDCTKFNFDLTISSTFYFYFEMVLRLY